MSTPAVDLPLLPQPAEQPAEEPAESTQRIAPAVPTIWRIEHDVLGRVTSCVDVHGSDYDVEGGRVSERYTGRVQVSTDTFAQRSESSADFTIAWPEATVRARTDVVLDASFSSYDVLVRLQTWRDGEPFADRRWARTIQRDLA